MIRRCCLALLLLLPAIALADDRCVQDDSGRQVCLSAPAQRIVALSPGATELLYQVGAGDRLVGTVTFSDYPAAARQLPRVGSYQRLDLEAILALRPDLIIAWRSGNPSTQVARLEQLGLTVYRSEPRRLADIRSTLIRFATLAGTEAVGRKVARHFHDSIVALRRHYADAAPVTVFYEVWNQPLMTVSGEHLISQAIQLCGGVNIFKDLSSLAPRVSQEAVIARDPEAIVVGGPGENDPRWLAPWKAFPALTAVQRGNLFFIPPSSLQRPTTRILGGIRHLCRDLEQARARR